MSLCLQSLEGIVFSVACFQFYKEDSYFHSQLEYAQAYQIEEETWADEVGGFQTFVGFAWFAIRKRIQKATSLWLQSSERNFKCMFAILQGCLEFFEEQLTLAITHAGPYVKNSIKIKSSASLCIQRKPRVEYSKNKLGQPLYALARADSWGYLGRFLAGGDDYTQDLLARKRITSSSLHSENPRPPQGWGGGGSAWRGEEKGGVLGVHGRGRSDCLVLSHHILPS